MHSQQPNECFREEFSPGFKNATERFKLLVAGDTVLKLEKLRKEKVDALYIIYPDSMKTLAQSCFFGSSGCRKTLRTNPTPTQHG